MRCGGVNQTGARAARTYLAESIANGASEWLMEGYNYKPAANGKAPSPKYGGPMTSAKVSPKPAGGGRA